MNIETYVNQAPKQTQPHLTTLIKCISDWVPEADTCINYGMPTFKLYGNLIHVAAYEKHIGFYPAPSAIAKFEKQLKPYTYSKGAVQFKPDKPLPLALIKKIVRFRVDENINTWREKRKKICTNGHVFYKSSDCKSCPVCAKITKPTSGFLSQLPAPARRALQRSGITTLNKLAQFTEHEILALHGIGKTTIPLLNKSLKQAGLRFK